MSIDRISDELMERGCTCFISPPCSFCTSLTEVEVDIYSGGGMKALREYHSALEEVDPNLPHIDLF